MALRRPAGSSFELGISKKSALRIKRSPRNPEKCPVSSAVEATVFIVWGTKIRRKRLGRVADFCSICHGVRPYELFRIGSVRHVYYLAFGQGRLLGHEIVCEDCRTPRQTEAAAYTAVESDRGVDVEALRGRTHPDLEIHLAERLALEERGEAGELTPAERRELLLEAFLLVNPMLERQLEDRRMGPTGRKIGWFTLAALVGFFVAIAGAMPEPLVIAAAVLFGTGFVVTLFHMATHMGSFVKREALPRIVRALEPWRPTIDELDRVCSHLRSIGLVIGRKLKADRIYGAIEEARV